MEYTKVLFGSKVRDDPFLDAPWRRFTRACRSNQCLEASRQLLTYLTKEDPEMRVQKGCDIIDLLYQPDYEKQSEDIYPCYRDFIIFKATSLLQGVMQGMFIHSVYSYERTKGAMPSLEVAEEIYPYYKVASERLEYYSNKCVYEQQGEAIAL